MQPLNENKREKSEQWNSFDLKTAVGQMVSFFIYLNAPVV